MRDSHPLTVDFNLRPNRNTSGQFEKIFSVLAGVVSHASDHPFMVEQIIRKRWDVTHVNPPSTRVAALSKARKAGGISSPAGAGSAEWWTSRTYGFGAAGHVAIQVARYWGNVGLCLYRATRAIKSLRLN